MHAPLRKQTDRQIDRKAHRQTDRQTDKQGKTYTDYYKWGGEWVGGL